MLDQLFVARCAMRIRLRDIGILPLLISLPFMFYPRILGGDTQPWVFMAATIALFTFRTDCFINKRDVILIVLSLLCIFTYAFRSAYGYELVRHVYTYLAFIIFWVVCRRENGEYFPVAVKATVILWFVVGLYQFLAVKFGYPVDFFGRYVEGRSGVPSLTAEPSFYGSLSVLQLMYLLDDKGGVIGANKIFIVCALASVVMSGSALAMILLVFALWKLPRNIRNVLLFLLPAIIFLDYNYSLFGMMPRLMDIASRGMGINMLFVDHSLNLRAGHIYYTMVENLVPSLLLLSPIDFMVEYNLFAVNSGFFVATGSNFILPAIGEMIYGSGFLAALMLLVLLKRSQEYLGTTMEKLEKTVFIIACMFNPISISNIFLIIYVTQKGRLFNEGYCYRSDRPGWLLYGPQTVAGRIRSAGADNG